MESWSSVQAPGWAARPPSLWLWCLKAVGLCTNVRSPAGVVCLCLLPIWGLLLRASPPPLPADGCSLQTQGGSAPGKKE